jgi:hypothetical protein
MATAIRVGATPAVLGVAVNSSTISSSLDSQGAARGATCVWPRTTFSQTQLQECQERLCALILGIPSQRQPHVQSPGLIRS